RAESTLGVGTRFEVWLPAWASGEVGSSLPVPQASSVHGKGETVLVLDADGELLLRHEEVLAALGYEPVGFTQAADAIAACRQAPGRLDLVLLCCIRSRGSTEVAAALHKIAPQISIILASPSAGDLDAAALTAAGVSEFIHYPPVSADLAGALVRSLVPRERV